MNAFIFLWTMTTLSPSVFLNTFSLFMKKDPHVALSKSDASRQRVLHAALALFRKKGFDATTMRDIAKAAKMSLGATYYYFGSKEDLVVAYYWSTQEAHASAIEQGLAGLASTEERLRFVLRAKLNIVAPDMRILGAIFKFAGDPGHALCVFGPQTQSIREQSIGLFLDALRPVKIAAPAKEMFVNALWLAQLGLILHGIHDQTPKLARTYGLADLIARWAARLCSLASLPFVTDTMSQLAQELLALKVVSHER